MQNIRNFQQVQPTEEQKQADLELFGKVSLYLLSEDGQDWYECQSQFADDTIKIMYDGEGIIRSVVDRPVFERNNTYAVSMFFPVGMSVAELAVDNFPADFVLDGTWIFDGTAMYRDETKVGERENKNNNALMWQYAAKASSAISIIQSSLAVNNSRIGDTENLSLLQQYLDDLREVDLTAPIWPPQPEFII